MRKPVGTRKCISCGGYDNKANLIRFCKTDNEIIIDKDNKIQAKGSYICKDMKCVNSALKNKFFNKLLRKTLTMEEREQIKEKFENLIN